MKIGDKLKPRVPIVDNGTYVAVCVGVLFIGEQYKEYKESKGYEDQIVFVWELPYEPDAEGRAKQLSKDLRVTVSDKGNLFSIMSAWNGRTYTPEELAQVELFDQIGKACQLVVSVSKSGFSNVDAVAGFPKGIPLPEASGQAIRFDVDQWDEAAFLALPDWAQNKVKKSTQYQQLHTPTDNVDFAEPVQAAATVTPTMANGNTANTPPDKPEVSLDASRTADANAEEDCPF